MLEEITPLILTFNEAPNIERTLRPLTWAKRIVLLDSFSTDETLDIARQLPQIEVVQRQFDDFASQCNFGLTQIHTPWVLSLDADYVLRHELLQELSALRTDAPISGYRAGFRYCINGKPLRGTLYPPRVVLYRCAMARYDNDGHGHRVKINGLVTDLRGKIDHDDRKPLDRWFRNQITYARLEAEKLIAAEMRSRPQEEGEQPGGKREGESSGEALANGTLSANDRIRRTGWLAPLLVLPYCLIVKRGILDGWAGWYYALQRLVAEVLLCLELAERRMGGTRDKS